MRPARPCRRGIGTAQLLPHTALGEQSAGRAEGVPCGSRIVVTIERAIVVIDPLQVLATFGLRPGDGNEGTVERVARGLVV